MNSYLETMLSIKSQDKKNIILLGAGGHSKSCIDVIENEDNYKIRYILGNKNEIGNEILGYKVIDRIENVENYNDKNTYFLITIGMVKITNIRLELFKKLKDTLKFAKIISPLSHIGKNCSIGDGTIIMHGAVINSDSIIGNNCIVNTKSLIEHDCVIGDNCHISTSAIVNGGVNILGNSFIGSGSIIKNGITLQENTFVPMGRKISKPEQLLAYD